MTPVVRSISLPTQVTLQYVEQGDPAGVPVIFLHGITDSWRSFEPVLPYLPASIHAFALTQRGHGDADRPESGYHPCHFAADVAAFVDALDLGPAVVAGHSMGSEIARRVAIDDPDCVRGLVLMGSFVTYQDNRAMSELWEAVSTLTDPINKSFAREFQVSTLARPAPPEYLDIVVQESLKVPARVWKAAVKGLIEGPSLGELSQIAAPTLIVWGDQDLYCPRGDQEALLAAIRGSRLVEYPGAGHAFHWEEPARFAADLAEFIRSVLYPGREEEEKR